jgi:uncharacterized protein (DUF4415 family)
LEKHRGKNRLKSNGSEPKQRKSKNRPRTDWNKLHRISPAKIRKGIDADPDANPTDAKFWKIAKVVMPAPKEVVTMRLDADLLRWFRRKPGYQTRINAILRSYMHARGST